MYCLQGETDVITPLWRHVGHMVTVLPVWRHHAGHVIKETGRGFVQADNEYAVLDQLEIFLIDRVCRKNTGLCSNLNIVQLIKCYNWLQQEQEQCHIIQYHVGYHK